ncbi:unnamed protein product [Sphenostylis stenocarpa]|uniref:Uncharacterized protein n=1 Tax=Sphenostylis stenocarpa TaxID=92480 RepID=A0AA86SFU7_9FABA|nr:unnamed protein product [Sphenostylis stenocarpa]
MSSARTPRLEPTFWPKNKGAPASDSLNNQAQQVFFPADSAKPVPLAVVSPDSRQDKWESR